jgi:hypothetical protein
VVVLAAGDTCVDPDHRRRGLSAQLGRFAARELSGRFPVFLNLSCGANSYPGYIRLGFSPVAPKTYLHRYRLFALARALIDARSIRPLAAARIGFGRSGDVVVSERPDPGAMAAIASREEPAGFLTLERAEPFFAWRFRNPLRKYVFYYLVQDDHTRAYVVAGVSPSNRRGYLLDWAGLDDGSVAALIRFIVRSGHFGVLSVLGLGVRGAVASELKREGFRHAALLTRIERRVDGGVFPMLVRPVTPDPDERDWFVAGLDLRKIDSWSIRGICSDAT